MRLSGLVIAAILLISATLLAQHSSGGGGSSSGGSSHGGYSGGSASSASSASSHASSASALHVSSTSAAGSHASSSSKLPPGKGNAAPEKKSSRSFFHPFRKPQPVQNVQFKRPVTCLKAPCPVCPSGQFRGGNACGVATNACASGQSWNGFACGAPYRFDDCGALAAQLEAERRHLQGQSDPGQALYYRLLLQQYQSCLARSNSRAFGSAFLADSLFALP